ncbi:hypothetical protein EYF80_029993 [Liparis tanakae]|uniref:Uncharacterized protein n=1 Tax=Liparis tanakae TaxID=230148 RepID=A0A4Z2H1R2_9TELE|nr:hypothetical protein EYF80_029993 [Liparis tanakae]
MQSAIAGTGIKASHLRWREEVKMGDYDLKKTWEERRMESNAVTSGSADYLCFPFSSHRTCELDMCCPLVSTTSLQSTPGASCGDDDYYFLRAHTPDRQNNKKRRRKGGQVTAQGATPCSPPGISDHMPSSPLHSPVGPSRWQEVVQSIWADRRHTAEAYETLGLLHTNVLERVNEAIRMHTLHDIILTSCLTLIHRKFTMGRSSDQPGSRASHTKGRPSSLTPTPAARSDRAGRCSAAASPKGADRILGGE